MAVAQEGLRCRVHVVVVLADRERRHLLNHLTRPARIRCPDFTRSEQIRNRVDAHHLVIAPTGRELIDRDAHVAQLLNEWCSSGFLFNNKRIGLPLLPVLERCLLEVRECHPVLERIQEDDLRAVVFFLVVEHPPCGASAVVRVVLGLERRVPALDDVLALRRLVCWPDAPVLAADNSRAVRRGLLHVLRVPVSGVKAGFCRLERLQRPLLGPERLFPWRVLVEDGGQLDDFPWNGVWILRLVINKFACQVQQGPSGHDDYDCPARHQALQRPRLEPRPRRVKSKAAVGFYILFRVRVVHHKQISAPSGQSAAHTGCVVLPALRCAPLSSGFLVVRHRRGREKLLVLV